MRLRARVVAAVAVLVAVTGTFLLPAEGVDFTNSTPITMPALGPTVPAPWPGSPYPSNITVSGLSGTVTDVNVILNDFDCSARGQDFAYPEDVDLLLVGPTGANLVILSDIGGANQDDPIQFTNIDVTLDDEAANPVPAETLVTSGTYRPTDDDNDPQEQVAVDTFPAPAPAPSNATALSVFDGTNPNGTWSLYYADDFAGPQNCTINGGWTLQIETSGGGGPTTTTPTTTPTTTTPTTTTPTTTTPTTTTPTTTTPTTTTPTTTTPTTTTPTTTTPTTTTPTTTTPTTTTPTTTTPTTTTPTTTTPTTTTPTTTMPTTTTTTVQPGTGICAQLLQLRAQYNAQVDALVASVANLGPFAQPFLAALEQARAAGNASFNRVLAASGCAVVGA